MNTKEKSARKLTIILFPAFFFIPILAIMGYMMGLDFYQKGAESYPYDNWKDLGSPPGGIKHLLEARTATVYVLTNEENIYFCYRESRYDEECWVKVDAVPPLDYLDDFGTCDQPIWGMPPEPDNIVERLVAHHCINSPVYEGDHAFVYLLRADSHVLQWISEPIGGTTEGQNRQYILKSFGGCFVGIFIGVAIVFLLIRFTSAKSSLG